jgi:glyoxylase-like metal-dependent hydrolase (beta-lactamase superfamily II)
MASRVALIIALAGAVGCLTAAAQAQTKQAPMSALALKDRVYWVKGGAGANTGFIVGSKEVLVIDAKMTEEAAKAMQAEIRKVTPLPVGRILLTHSDGDHVNGLAGFPQGLPILAHANTKKDMEEAFKDPKLASLLPYLPNRTSNGDLTGILEGVRVNALYFGPAHTSGDWVVHLPDHKIAFVGDLVFVGRDPLIHRRKGGNSFGLVKVLQKIVALDADTFVSGHSDPLTKADIKNLIASIEEKQAKVKGLIQQGKPLDEIKAAFGAVSAPGQPAPRFPSLIDIIYQELTEK